MKYLLTISLSFFTFILIGQSGTTLDEYRYLSKGYAYQVEMGLDPTKNGYEIRNNYTAKNGTSIIGLYRNDTQMLQGLLFVSIDTNGKPYYQAIPNPSSTENVLALYQQNQGQSFPKIVLNNMMEAKNHYLFSIPRPHSEGDFTQIQNSSQNVANYSQNNSPHRPNNYNHAPQPQNDQLTSKGGSSIPIENPIGSSDSKSKLKGKNVDGQLNVELSSRKVLILPNTQNTTKSQGRIMIKFCVDSTGEVIFAKFTQRGSTTLNNELIKLALTAVRKMQLAPSETAEECGTVGFDF